MKIDSFAVNMSSASSSVKSFTVRERAVLGIQPFSLPSAVSSPSDQSGGGGASLLTLSREGQALSSDSARETNAPREAGGAFGAVFSDKDEMKLRLIEQLMQSLTGKKYSFNRFDARRMGDNRPPQMPQSVGAPAYKLAFQIQAMPLAQVNLSVSRTETYYESQSMSFKASGVVNTSDGRQINFDLNILANYEFSSSVSSAVSGLRLMDPLVINFNGTLPEFTKDRYEFDITIDGSLENIFMPTNGSGFLALDRDGNGKIDDGSELFGARTGDGFGELAAYDSDGNGWIDEGDDVFDQLKIMFADRETGEFMMISLKEAGVGAIYLGSTASGGFEIKAADNETAGVVRRSGIFLSESGAPGSIHHIDLTY